MCSVCAESSKASQRIKKEWRNGKFSLPGVGVEVCFSDSTVSKEFLFIISSTNIITANIELYAKRYKHSQTEDEVHNGICWYI